MGKSAFFSHLLFQEEYLWKFCKKTSKKLKKKIKLHTELSTTTVSVWSKLKRTFMRSEKSFCKQQNTQPWPHRFCDKAFTVPSLHTGGENYFFFQTTLQKSPSFQWNLHTRKWSLQQLLGQGELRFPFRFNEILVHESITLWLYVSYGWHTNEIFPSFVAPPWSFRHTKSALF